MRCGAGQGRAGLFCTGGDLIRRCGATFPFCGRGRLYGGALGCAAEGEGTRGFRAAEGGDENPSVSFADSSRCGSVTARV